MKTREITEIKLFKLVLNPMTCRCEEEIVCAISDDINRLKEFLKGEFEKEPYDDSGYRKVFKKGSPLEWYNPHRGGLRQNTISEEWVDIRNL